MFRALAVLFLLLGLIALAVDLYFSLSTDGLIRLAALGECAERFGSRAVVVVAVSTRRAHGLGVSRAVALPVGAEAARQALGRPPAHPGLVGPFVPAVPVSGLLESDVQLSAPTKA